MSEARATDPETPDEWQQAVDAADFLLLLDSAAQYGLVAIDGGGSVDVDRCRDLLHRAAGSGIYPADPRARRRAVADWLWWERNDLGLSQRQLAQRCGVSQALLSYIELGRHAAQEATLAQIRAGIETIREEQTI